MRKRSENIKHMLRRETHGLMMKRNSPTLQLELALLSLDF